MGPRGRVAVEGAVCGRVALNHDEVAVVLLLRPRAERPLVCRCEVRLVLGRTDPGRCGAIIQVVQSGLTCGGIGWRLRSAPRRGQGVGAWQMRGSNTGGPPSATNGR